MYKINVVCVGNLKDKFFKDAQEEYLKRISRFAEITVIECAESKEDGVNAVIKEENGILAALKGFVILLDIGGTLITSEDLASTIQKAVITQPQITFVIGGSRGVSDKVRASSMQKISFGRITLPHRLCRIVLEEQIYRGLCIINNVPYHK
ncbi:MAG: 23S rRNA (pseudouridine(1915)-N(3))-methyltransferase RlmH [Christensenellaceae bacterium]|jgi:23S rRNA (pseudouridine1915-N3)-methyltransferase|nr:23S rRNA (pseudouridine(1915)-N(3))-methyltransferase RlmH [Christensenellaceae bacterium]